MSSFVSGSPASRRMRTPDRIPQFQAVVARPEALGFDALAVDGLLSFVTFELE